MKKRVIGIFDKIKGYGVRELALKISQYLYRNIFRRVLPRIEYREFNGIKVCEKIKLGDKLLPAGWKPYNEEHIKTYEEGLVNALETHVRPGNNVIVVGGGYGVTAVKASILTKETGSVTCYEPAFKEYKKVKKAFVINDTPNNYQILNTCVGTPVSVYGEFANNSILEPEELPMCDVLQLDCEGTEKEILNQMKIAPRIVIVETHGLYGASTDDISNILKRRGYTILSSEIAEPRKAEFCSANDIKVLAAHKKTVG